MIELVAVVTVLPDASCTATLGWVGSATPPVEPLGCWLNPSFDAAAAFTVTEKPAPFEIVPSLTTMDAVSAL